MESQLRRLTEAERETARTTFFACIAGTGLDAAVNRVTLEAASLASRPRRLRGGADASLGKLLSAAHHRLD